MAEKELLDRDNILKTLDQLEQTIKVMNAVVNKLRDHVTSAVPDDGVAQMVNGVVVGEKDILH